MKDQKPLILLVESIHPVAKEALEKEGFKDSLNKPYIRKTQKAEIPPS